MRDVNVALPDLGDPVTHASSLYGNFFPFDLENI